MKLFIAILHRSARLRCRRNGIPAWPPSTDWVFSCDKDGSAFGLFSVSCGVVLPLDDSYS